MPPNPKPGARANRRGSVKGVVVVLVDVINAFDFPGSAAILKSATRAAVRIERLAERARAERVPVIYVNDNFGRWRSDFQATVSTSTASGSPGRVIAERLRPKPSDYFVLKPQHSGFFSTTLDPLLAHLQARTLIIAGFAANLCVLFTANDAHMRGYQIAVPRDCTAANTPALARAALSHVRIALSGDTRESRHLQFGALARQAKKPRSQPFAEG
jgi:nicotinamidase-related amidase